MYIYKYEIYIDLYIYKYELLKNSELFLQLKPLGEQINLFLDIDPSYPMNFSLRLSFNKYPYPINLTGLKCNMKMINRL